MKRNWFTLFVAVLTLALPALAQGAKSKEQPGRTSEAKEKLGKTADTPTAREKAPAGKVTLVISQVVKEDARARNVPEGRLIPVRVEWLCNGSGNAKLVTLEAKLITLNSDGKPTTVTKRLTDWTLNKPITSVLDLPMAKDVFAKSFTLELVGKFHDGVVERAVSTVKQGNFPVPNATEQKR